MMSFGARLGLLRLHDWRLRALSLVRLNECKLLSLVELGWRSLGGLHIEWRLRALSLVRLHQWKLLSLVELRCISSRGRA